LSAPPHVVSADNPSYRAAARAWNALLRTAHDDVFAALRFLSW
jgi:hypothetical protein